MAKPEFIEELWEDFEDADLEELNLGQKLLLDELMARKGDDKAIYEKLVSWLVIQQLRCQKLIETARDYFEREAFRKLKEEYDGFFRVPEVGLKQLTFIYAMDQSYYYRKLGQEDLCQSWAEVGMAIARVMIREYEGAKVAR